MASFKIKPATCVVLLDNRCDDSDKSCSNLKSIQFCTICGCNVSYIPVMDAIMRREQTSLLNELVKKSKSIIKQEPTSPNLICTRCSSSLKQMGEIKAEMDKMGRVLDGLVTLIEMKMVHRYRNHINQTEENGMD